MPSKVTSCSFLCALGILLGCSPTKNISSESYLLYLHAQDDLGAPLEGVRVEQFGKTTDPTDSLGNLRLQITGWEGEEKTLQVICPKGYRSEEQTTRVRLRTLRPLDSSSSSRVIEHEISCHPTLRKVVLAVRTGGIGTTTVVGIVDGTKEHTLAHTVRAENSSLAVGHAVLSVPPQSTLRVRIDTSSHPRARPQQPAFHFDIEDKDAFFLLEQDFEHIRQRRKRTPSRTKPRPTRRPIRIR